MPRLLAARQWTRAHWRLGAGLAGGGSIEQLSGRVALGLIGAIAGNAALGTFAAARTVLAPATTAVASTLSFAVPEAVRMRARGDRRVGRLIAGLSLALGGVVTLFAVAIGAAPDSVGELIAGRNWDTARVLLLPVAVAGAALAARQGPRVGLRVFERSGTVLRLSTVTGVIVVLATAIGATTGGAEGAAWAFAAAHVASTLAWWLGYRRWARADARVPATA
ncbi:MAG: hypothetical protein H0U35_00895 [Sporichthyaceae bacterium]|nr:hypothetical protein [Sporichthyaceae bacterium]